MLGKVCRQHLNLKVRARVSEPNNRWIRNKIEFEGSVFYIDAYLSNGTIETIEVDPEFTSIIIFVRSKGTEDGKLTISLPRQLIDSRIDGEDDEFIVLVDGEDSEFQEVKTTATERMLIIPVAVGAEEIEIVGTKVGTTEVSYLPEIVFDKDEYTPFDYLVIAIIAPQKKGTRKITASIRSSIDNLDPVEFIETGANTGIFEKEIRLTPDKSIFSGDLVTKRQDAIYVEVQLDKDSRSTKNASVNYHVGIVEFDKDAYRLSERAIVRVIDPDENRNPDAEDVVNVHMWSTTDNKGLVLHLKETGHRTGIFESVLSFATDQESNGNTLKVREGDTITTKYVDKTLPPPAKLDSNGIETVDVEELFASALIGAMVPPLERVVTSEPELVDQTGQSVTNVVVGSPVMIQSKVVNAETKRQSMTYIVQIADKDGVTVSLSWVTAELPPKNFLTIAQSWIPDVPGEYTIEIFVWRSIDNPTALSPVRATKVTVSGHV